jgi:hypothetical protein
VRRYSLTRPLLAGLGLAATTAGCASAPAAGPMITDRPDFTESAGTVPAGVVQVETGYTVTGSGEGTEQSVGEALIRVGVEAGAELRIGPGSYGIQALDDGSRTTGPEDASLGVKIELPAGGLVEGLALIVATAVPVPSDLGHDGWSPSGVVAAAWTVGPVDVGANAGYSHVFETGGGGEWLGSVAAGAPLSETLGAFVELYGFLPESDDPRGVLDGGLTLAVTPDVQLDFRGGRPLQGPNTFIVGFGLSTRW